MTKAGIAIFVMLATLWPIGRMSIAQSPDQRAPAEGPQATRRVARRGPPGKKSDRRLTAEAESRKPAEHERAVTAAEVDELREELKRLKSEVRRLKSSPEETVLTRDEALTGSTGSVFDDGDAELVVDKNNGNPDTAVEPFSIPLDDELPQSEGPFENIQLIQDEDHHREFGGVPGHHFRPRTDELGSIGLPEMRPYKPDMRARKRKLEAEFSEGLNVRTDDDYFSLTFHNLTQVDLRVFNPTGDPLHDNFIIPRQRWYVLGNVSPYVRYYTVINRGYGSLDLLDAWIDFSVGGIDRDKFQIRVGRMKTPYTYEYIKVSENDLIAAERSVFVGNLAPNREIGLMAHGQVLDLRLEYAVGAFNGPRHSFQDFNDGKDLFTFLNTKPFLKGDSELLRQLNIGGSFNWGNQHNPAQPFALQTANDQSSSAATGNVSPTFFRFAPNAFENGERMQWSGDLAYYYKSLGMLAGYQGGFQDYALSVGTLPGTEELRLGTQQFVGVVSGAKTRVPMTGYSVALFYFLTGEEITRRRDLLEPRQEYAGSQLSKGRFGAVEAFSRFAFMSLGSNVFSAGLADPSISSNRVNVIDTGFNWYLNHYTKLTLDWQYSAYGNPVFLAPGQTTSFMNLFWFRTQVFF